MSVCGTHGRRRSGDQNIPKYRSAIVILAIEADVSDASSYVYARAAIFIYFILLVYRVDIQNKSVLFFSFPP